MLEAAGAVAGAVAGVGAGVGAGASLGVGVGLGVVAVVGVTTPPKRRQHQRARRVLIGTSPPPATVLTAVRPRVEVEAATKVATAVQRRLLQQRDGMVTAHGQPRRSARGLAMAIVRAVLRIAASVQRHLTLVA